jgi:hypothetical protein
MSISRVDIEEAVAEARRMVARVTTDERPLWENALRSREAYLRGELIIPISTVRQSAADAMADLEYKLQEAVSYARLMTEIEVIHFLRMRKLMCHSPLRAAEREWLKQLFGGDRRISRQRLFFPVELGEGPIEGMGGHRDPSGRWFVCRSCPDSRRKR